MPDTTPSIILTERCRLLTWALTAELGGDYRIAVAADLPELIRLATQWTRAVLVIDCEPTKASCDRWSEAGHAVSPQLGIIHLRPLPAQHEGGCRPPYVDIHVEKPFPLSQIRGAVRRLLVA